MARKINGANSRHFRTKFCFPHLLNTSCPASLIWIASLLHFFSYIHPVMYFTCLASSVLNPPFLNKTPDLIVSIDFCMTGMVTVFCAKLGWTSLELLLGQFQVVAYINTFFGKRGKGRIISTQASAVHFDPNIGIDYVFFALQGILCNVFPVTVSQIVTPQFFLYLRA